MRSEGSRIRLEGPVYVNSVKPHQLKARSPVNTASVTSLVSLVPKDPTHSEDTVAAQELNVFNGLSFTGGTCTPPPTGFSLELFIGTVSLVLVRGA